MADLKCKNGSKAEVDLAKFISAIFNFTSLPPDVRVCLTLAHDDGGWSNFPATPKRMAKYVEGSGPWYFCISTCAPPDGTGYFQRGREFTRYCYCLVLDDIGTKATAPDVEPSWKLESSEGNYQWGYMIEPVNVADPAGEAYVEGCQKAISRAGYSDDGAGGTYRVVRVPGSLHRTGFVSRVTDWHPDRVWLLEDLMAQLGLEPVKLRERSPRATGPGIPAHELQDPVLDWLVENGHTTDKVGPKFFEVICPWASEHTSGGDTAGYTPAGYDPGFDHAFSCLHEHCQGRGKHEFLDWVAENGGPDPRAPAGPCTLFPTDKENQRLVALVTQNLTEDSLAEALAQLYEGQFLYLHGSGKWYRWDGTRWRVDLLGSIWDEARYMSRSHNKSGKGAPAKASFVRGTLAHAERDPRFARDMASFDNDNYLLNTPGGTVDLRTGQLRAHDPGDNITKITAVAPSAGGKRFLRFIDEITGGDQDLANFLQRSLGACLSGAIEEHWLLFWVGGGRNGKNTLGDLVMHVMGDYARAVPTKMLMAQQYEDHPTEIMNLRGVRLAVSSELNQGARWNESRLNQLTGDTRLTGRYMRQDLVEFERTHKHLVYANSRPGLDNITPALRSRLVLVPFSVSFEGREDPDLPAALRAEGGAVLQWLIDGHQLWLVAGKKVGTCEAVTKESGDYFETQDILGQWLEARCSQVPDDGRAATGWASGGELHADHMKWCEEEGVPYLSKNQFGQRLKARLPAVVVKVSNGNKRYCGLILLSRLGKDAKVAGRIWPAGSS
jgi:putative DNA primase/helicase